MNDINYEKCGKYFGYLFWMLIPRVVTTAFVYINAPAAKIAGTALRIVFEFLSVYFLWQLQSEDGRFKKVSIIYIGVVVCETVMLILGRGQILPVKGLSSIFSLAGAVLSLLYIINLYPLLSDILAGPSEELSKRWLFIRKLFVIGTIVTLASSLMILIPTIGTTAVLVGVIIMLIASILDLITMYKSSVVCKKYDIEKKPETH